MESKNPEAALSLIESGRESTFSYQAEREQLEHLKNRIRVLESENTELKRLQPRLKDAYGKDCTSEFSKLVKELQIAKNNCEDWENEHRKLLKNHTELEQSALKQIDQRDNELREIKRKAMELEEENSKLREQIHDEQSKIHRLQEEQQNQSLNELHLRDQIQNSLLNESLANLNINDADQIATHIFMILETLDKNNRDNKEIQTSIFTFLGQHGLSADPENAALFSKIYKEAVARKQSELRVVNDQLLLYSTNKNGNCNTSIGDAQFQACLRHLYQESMSTTFVTQQSDISIAEYANESVNAMNLAGRTANLAEVCVQMFEKLRGTAEFFQQLLSKFDVSVDEVGEDLMRKIVRMKLDLDKSMDEARCIVDEAKHAEKNIRTFLMEQSQNSINSMIFEPKEDEKCKELQEKIVQLEQVNSKLEEEKEQMGSSIEEKYKELQEKIVQLEQVNSKLEEEKEQVSSSIKENLVIPRTQLVEGIRGELGKIYDTMSFASSRLSSSSKKAPLQKKSSNPKKNYNKRSEPPTSSQQQSTSQTTERVD